MDRFQKTRLLRVVFLTAFAVFAVNPMTAEMTTETVRDITEKTNGMKPELPAMDNPKAEEAAKKAYGSFTSPEFRERLEKEKARIRESLFSLPGKGDGNEPEGRRLGADERIFVLVSSSMPETALKTYARDIAALGDGNAVMVMRGFIDGIRKPRSTMAFIKRIMQNGKGGEYRVKMQIDPHIYVKFDVRRVPAVIYAWNLELVDAIQSVGMPGNMVREPEAVVVFGDASLAHALEQMYEETGRPVLKGAAKKIRGNFYDG